MKRLYRPNAFASVAELACAIRHPDRPVILVEGTRDLPEADRPLAVALDAVPAAEQVLASASPRSQRRVELYVREKGGSAAAAKGAYLMRDTLKVLGCAELHLAPATVGIFHVNEADPMAGGTGHTIRVSIEHGVPVVPQKIWRNWLTSSPADSPPPGCSHL
jgi:hypothetical protein